MIEIEPEAILSRIAVQRPYFSFGRLFMGSDGTVHGEFVPEQPTEWERGLVSAAEVGRHLAILGSIAATATTEESTRVYHLATRALFIRLRPPIVDRQTDRR